MRLTSNSFNDGGSIPAKHAMKAIPGGANVSPHIKISDVPPGSVSLAIIFVDRHPMARNWVHWLVTGLAAKDTEIAEGSSMNRMPTGCLELANTFGFSGYGGPQPPRGSGVHRYELAAYALSANPDTGRGELSEKAFLALIENKVLAKSAITGGFENS
ncbi:MAG TPA: YbhB/YbcL family Raf kinase inhibitor-like protein [Spirochaetota bacterium]|nr:YbhB/YbcL family Raf kinase inhibitor-like protein [Spirochaetota bacterium]OPZ38318.1 MAG: putative kinase inhibitor protein [Spirochaetes bacterium ADurb.BinA120]HNU91238.1 YbhB/YbcL family Raf kinase inhibitor-like protein [Spirochaetota bacterium]HPV97871.1 YbhB/YbcL family Raf kinase inhibitor-like protein [Spirochaetota bacterium]